MNPARPVVSIAVNIRVILAHSTPMNPARPVVSTAVNIRVMLAHSKPMNPARLVVSIEVNIRVILAHSIPMNPAGPVVSLAVNIRVILPHLTPMYPVDGKVQAALVLVCKLKSVLSFITGISIYFLSGNKALTVSVCRYRYPDVYGGKETAILLEHVQNAASYPLS
jgi:hypothetical protein